jgi:hypothetical protein
MTNGRAVPAAITAGSAAIHAAGLAAGEAGVREEE